MGYNSGITFFNSKNNAQSTQYYQDVADLDSGYDQCKVETVNANGAVWILYGVQDFGGQKAGKGQSYACETCPGSVMIALPRLHSDKM